MRINTIGNNYANQRANAPKPQQNVQFGMSMSTDLIKNLETNIGKLADTDPEKAIGFMNTIKHAHQDKNHLYYWSEKTDVVGALNKNDAKIEEVYGQLTYKMSKNLTTYLRYGTYEQKVESSGVKQTDNTRGRIQVAYTF